MVLLWHTSLYSDRLLVFSTLVAFGLDLFESRLKSLGARVELRFGTLELSTCTLVLCLGGIEGALARIKVILCTLEGGLGCFVSDASRANFFDQPTTLGDVTLSFRLVAVAIGCSAGGVWLAFYLDSAPAPTIVVLFTALFVVAFVASTIRDSQKQKTSAIIPGGG